MMHPSRFDQLLDAHFAGEASPQEAAELAAVLRDEHESRRLFVERSVLEVHLRKAFSGLAPTTMPTAKASRPRRPLGRRVAWLAVAVVLVAVGVTFRLTWMRSGAAPDRGEIQVAQHADHVPPPNLPKDAPDPEPVSHDITGTMASMDAVKNTITVIRDIKGIGSPQTFALKKDVVVIPADKNSGVAKVTDLKPNVDVNLKLSNDGKQVEAIREVNGNDTPGKGPRDLRGVLTSLDADSSRIAVRTKVKGRDAERSFEVHKDATIFIDGEAAGLGDLEPGLDVLLRLSEDRRMVIEIRNGKKGKVDEVVSWMTSSTTSGSAARTRPGSSATPDTAIGKRMPCLCSGTGTLSTAGSFI